MTSATKGERLTSGPGNPSALVHIGYPQGAAEDGLLMILGGCPSSPFRGGHVIQAYYGPWGARLLTHALRGGPH